MNRIGPTNDVFALGATGIPANSYEDSNSSHYRCCCNKWHARKLAGHLIVLQLIYALCNVFAATLWAHWLQLPVILVWVAVLAVGLYGVYKYSAMGLMPLVVVQALFAMIVIIVAMFTIGVMAGADFLSKYYGSSGSNNSSESVQTDISQEKVDDGKSSIHLLSAILLAFCLIMAAFCIWCLGVYYACLKYIQIRAHMLHLALAQSRLQ